MVIRQKYLAEPILLMRISPVKRLANFLYPAVTTAGELAISVEKKTKKERSPSIMANAKRSATGPSKLVTTRAEPNATRTKPVNSVGASARFSATTANVSNFAANLVHLAQKNVRVVASIWAFVRCLALFLATCYLALGDASSCLLVVISALHYVARPVLTIDIVKSVQSLRSSKCRQTSLCSRPTEKST